MNSHIPARFVDVYVRMIRTKCFTHESQREVYLVPIMFLPPVWSGSLDAPLIASPGHSTAAYDTTGGLARRLRSRRTRVGLVPPAAAQQPPWPKGFSAQPHTRSNIMGGKAGFTFVAEQLREARAALRPPPTPPRSERGGCAVTQTVVAYHETLRSPRTHRRRERRRALGSSS